MNSENSEKVLEFIKEFSSILKIEKIKIADLYHSYSNWCRRNEEPRMDKQLFCQKLDELGFKRIKMGDKGDEGVDLSMLTEELDGEPGDG